jgi:hypothetical protein
VKSKRRHDLKENELAKDIGRVGQFFRKHLNTILVATLGLVIVVALVIMLVNRRSARKQDEWRAYGNLVSQTDLTNIGDTRDGFESLAADTGQEALAGWANFELGTTIHTQLRTEYYKLDEAGRKKLVDQADEAFRKALSSADDFPTQAAAARVGLGLLAQTDGRFNEASENFEAAAAMGDKGIMPLAAFGKQVAQQAAQLDRSIVFQPGRAPIPDMPETQAPELPEAASQPETQPQTQPGPASTAPSPE